MRRAAGRIERVRCGHDDPRFGQPLGDLVGDPLDPRAAGDEAVGFAAFGTGGGRRGFVAAVMAGEPAAEAVLDQPGAAIGALEAEPAIAAQRQRRIAAAVEEQQRLFAAFQPFRDRRDQRFGEPGAAARLLLRQIDGGDGGHLRSAEAARELDAGVGAVLGHGETLERGRRARQHHRYPLEMPAHHRDVARVVAHPVVLLEADLMRLVDHHQPEPGIGQEQRRARADHHLRAALGDGAPGAPPLGRFERRMPQHRRGAEALLEAGQEGFGQSDLGQQHQHLPLQPQRLGDGFEIGLGLARSGHPVEQEGGELFGAHRRGEDIRRFALLGAEIGLRMVGVGARVGAVAIDLDGFEHTLVDQPAQHRF